MNVYQDNDAAACDGCGLDTVWRVDGRPACTFCGDFELGGEPEQVAFSFLGPPALPRHPRYKRFERLVPASVGKCGQAWRHTVADIEIRHCGHPTAHRPWYVHAMPADLADQINATIKSPGDELGFELNRPHKYLDELLELVEYALGRIGK